jgi:hypothetical protein
MVMGFLFWRLTTCPALLAVYIFLAGDGERELRVADLAGPGKRKNQGGIAKAKIAL